MIGRRRKTQDRVTPLLAVDYLSLIDLIGDWLLQSIRTKEKKNCLINLSYHREKEETERLLEKIDRD